MAKSKKSANAAIVNAAIRGGRSSGQQALMTRAKQSRRRARAEAKLAQSPARRRAAMAPSVPRRARGLLGTARSAGVLIAEGDSWFDYPLHDVLKDLEDDHAYDVHSVAHRGDRVEDMAYGPGQFEDFARLLEKLLRDGKVPKAILLSGGGNDIAGEEFELLLNHAASGLPPVNDDIVRGVIDVRLRAAYARIISGITTVAEGIIHKKIPILTHGYARPVPDGRGFLGGFGPLPGPWLRPGFLKKGYPDLRANTTVMAGLIDRFNAMVSGICSHPLFAHVQYLDLRPKLSNGSDYKQFWANELHPTKSGFISVTDVFAARIAAL